MPHEPSAMTDEELVRSVLAGDRDGFAELPVRPGLGIEVNEKALEKYREDAA